MKTSIAFVSKKMDCGGIEKAAIQLLQQLNPEEYDIDYYYRRRSHENLGELITELPEWVVKKEIVIPNLHNYRSLFTGFMQRVKFLFEYCLSYSVRKMEKTVQYSRQAKIAMKQDKEYDIAIAFDGPTAYGTFYTIEAIKAKKKILWIHGDVEKEGATTLLVFKYYAAYDRIITVSEESKKILIKTFPQLDEKVSVIYNYVDYADIRKRAEEKNQLVERLFYNYCGLKICTVGRLGEDKGMTLAAECCKLLKQKGIEFRWIICGEGPMRGLLEDFISEENLQEKFFLVGNQNNPYPFMRSCDIYVQPSIQEGFCTTTNEAKVLCKPVVATDVCGMAEQFQNGVTGVIVSKTPNDICAAILNLYSDENWRDSIVKQLTEIDWKKSQSNYNSILRGNL